MKRNHVPLRTCRGCGGKSPKNELVRFVWHEGELTEDKAQLLKGRGVYCCASQDCRKRLTTNRKTLQWALRLQR